MILKILFGVKIMSVIEIISMLIFKKRDFVFQEWDLFFYLKVWKNHNLLGTIFEYLKIPNLLKFVLKTFTNGMNLFRLQRMFYLRYRIDFTIGNFLLQRLIQ